MSSTLFVDAIEPNLSSGVHIAGHVIQVVNAEIGYQAIGAGSAKTTLQTFSITKKFSTSNILINMHVGYSNTSTTSNDDNSALFLLNTTDSNYINSRTIYNQPDAWWARDTNNNYAQNGNMANFQYHGYVASITLLDTTNTAGTISYSLQASVESSTLVVGRWLDNTITLMEIAQ